MIESLGKLNKKKDQLYQTIKNDFKFNQKAIKQLEDFKSSLES